MDTAYGIQAPRKHVGEVHRPPPRYLVIIDAAGSATALLFLETRELTGDVAAGSEEIASLTQGLTPSKTAHLAEWDVALAGHSAEERAVADVYLLTNPPAVRE